MERSSPMSSQGTGWLGEYSSLINQTIHELILYNSNMIERLWSFCRDRPIAIGDDWPIRSRLKNPGILQVARIVYWVSRTLRDATIGRTPDDTGQGAEDCHEPDRVTVLPMIWVQFVAPAFPVI